MGASLRQKAIGTMQGSEWLSTGDAAFDKVVFVAGDSSEMSAHLSADARTAVVAATQACWELEDMTLKAREFGRITSARKIRTLLGLGLAAANATRREDDPAGSMLMGVETASSSGLAAAVGEHGDRDLSPGGVSGTSEPVTLETAIEALAEVNTPRSLEAAMLLASAGDHRQEVRNRLVAALLFGLIGLCYSGRIVVLASGQHDWVPVEATVVQVYTADRYSFWSVGGGKSIGTARFGPGDHLTVFHYPRRPESAVVERVRPSVFVWMVAVFALVFAVRRAVMITTGKAAR